MHPSFSEIRVKKINWFKGQWLSLLKSKNLGKLFLFSFPYGWLLIFFAVPFFILLKISLSESVLGIPPYSAVFTWIKDYFLTIRLNFSSYHFLLNDSLYSTAYIESVYLAAIATFGCLLISYPMAYAIARSSPYYQSILLMLVVLPFWTSFLIRVYAWIGLLNPQGFINTFLMKLHIIDDPLPLIGNNFSVGLGIIYAYLPFMVLPLYATLSKMDNTLLEAAYDLGCRPFKAFLTVTLPLSWPGIVSGSLLVFIPAMGEYVIPELLGGNNTLMIGRVLWTEFFNNHDWPMASALAIAMVVLLVVPVSLLQQWQDTERKK
jgi:putrescine transport system permease protein